MRKWLTLLTCFALVTQPLLAGQPGSAYEEIATRLLTIGRISGSVAPCGERNGSYATLPGGPDLPPDAQTQHSCSASRPTAPAIGTAGGLTPCSVTSSPVPGRRAR